MTVLRRLLTPLGGAAALLICGLPWVRLECATTRADPSLWQLAEQEAYLYVFPIVAGLIVLLGVLYLVWQNRRLAGGILVAALAGVVAWVYTFLKRQELGEQQAAAAGLGGQLGFWMQQIKIHPLPAFYIFLGLMILTVFLAAASLVSNGDRSGSPGATR
jgi:hypothetical protein